MRAASCPIRSRRAMAFRLTLLKMMTRRELLAVFLVPSIFPLRQESAMEQRISLVTLGVKDLLIGA